ncbi:MAG TPA: gamma carbonic anhydrase family protein [Spirochaetota bacterium]|nr:gamma carbonic anhydrase family protein [Spirochaetota bacterium]HPI22716.1 gamma carbonic anhydrase family protein [Spirochaetota bacterium]HPU87546.1 gamma carbonic anhydrase family protein [Spirochaetota bacterium]
MPLYEYNGKRPTIGAGTWIAPNAHVVGDVSIGANSYVGFGAVIRGDFGTVVIGDETAVEEGVVIHTSTSCVIGSGVILGHLAMVHGARIDDATVIGMQATLCNESVVGSWTIVAEQSLVVKGQTVPGGAIVGGSPAREIGALTERHRAYIVHARRVYAELARGFAEGLRVVG